MRVVFNETFARHYAELPAALGDHDKTSKKP